MKRICLPIILQVLFPLISYGQIDIQSFNLLPDSLVKNMDAIILDSYQEFNIIDEKNTHYTVNKKIAILKKGGEHLAYQGLYYDDDTKINKFKGVAYNQFGKELEVITKKTMVDRSAISDFSLYEDNRIKTANLTQKKYPYFVEISYELTFKSLFYIPDFYLLSGWDESVVKSSYKLISPAALLPNYKVINGSPVINKSVENGVNTIELLFENIKGITYEPYSKGLQNITPAILLSPSRFKYDEYSGDMSTWESYGKWQLLLNEGRDILPDQTKIKIQSLVQDAQTIEEKSKIIYEYVQNKTRYVSIQLGIGGWQPFPASTVDEVGYGDCKALSNYTQALLKVVDVKSYYTKVHAESNPPPLYPDFSYNAFNHIILCVPTEQDTIWLECTSQTNPFGYMGSFTGDRDVLIINEDGGKIVHTPIYTKEDNSKKMISKISIGSDGSAEAIIEIVYSGLQSENLNYLLHEGVEARKNWVYKNTQLSDFDIRSLDINYLNNKIPKANQEMELHINKLASSGGKRLFFQPNVLNKLSYVPDKNEDRKFDLFFENEYIYNDSITFSIPENYHVEYLPEAINIESPFGIFSYKISAKNDVIIFVRQLELNKGTFDKSLYNEYREFKKSIVKADQAKIVLIDKT